MQANHRTETRPERLLRSALHARGYRFRKDRRVQAGGRWVRPDIVFGTVRVAVFVDGCFWHRCPIHSKRPRKNAAYWQVKFARNVARDEADAAALADAGWAVVRVWEHDEPEMAAERIGAVIRHSRDQVI
jgi:DNA mismatch endonuclease, patch repair protein